MLPLGLLAGGIASIFKIGHGARQNHLANKVVVPDASYETSPYAKKMLAEAAMLKNSRMPGAMNAERNIATNGANAFGSVERNASSGAQALALLSGITGNTNNAYNQLGQQEAGYGLQTQGMYNNALGTMINEGDKKYMDDVRKQQLAIGEKNALRGAATQNIGGGMNDIINNAWAFDNWKQQQG